MKVFEAPKMTLVHLANEGIITQSGGCSENMCYGYECDDCSCTGYTGCYVQKCTGYYCNAQVCPTYVSA